MSRQLEYELSYPCVDSQASLVRMLNVVPGLTVDIYINDEPRINNLSYMNLTSYMSTRPGTRNFKIYESNTQNLLLEIVDFDVIGGQLLTYVIFGNKNDLNFLPIVDDVNESVMPDETKVRYYNLASSSMQFTLASPTGLPHSTVLDSGSGTEYTDINPGSYSLKLNFSNQNSKTISINFKPGRIYTIYIIDNISSDSPNYSQFNIPQVILVVDGNTLFNNCTFF